MAGLPLPLLPLLRRSPKPALGGSRACFWFSHHGCAASTDVLTSSAVGAARSAWQTTPEVRGSRACQGWGLPSRSNTFSGPRQRIQLGERHAVLVAVRVSLEEVADPVDLDPLSGSRHGERAVPAARGVAVRWWVSITLGHVRFRGVFSPLSHRAKGTPWNQPPPRSQPYPSIIPAL